MSKYIKLDDAIEAYNQAVTLLVESEMEEFNLGDFTECSFNTTQIKLIARMIESLPTIEVMEYPQVEGITPTLVTPEVSEDCISREQVRAKLDYISYAEKDPISIAKRIVEDAPSVVPSRAEGEWIFKRIFPNDDSEFPMGYLVCSVCGSQHTNATPCNYCDNCGAKMKGGGE